MANNSRSLRDADGDASDWIEIQNVSSQTVNLAGWRLTDDATRLIQWVFPATNLAPQGFLIVFASGKNRASAGQELHTDFQLEQSGEYLALIEPDGVTLATEFAPTFPPQFEDVSYGRSRKVLGQQLLSIGSPARILIPTSEQLGATWQGAPANEPFDDSAARGWLQATTGVGYEIVGQTDSLRPMGYWDFNSNHATQILDVSGRNHHGTLLSGASYTTNAGGYTGRPGDRALRVSGGARAVIADAANGVYDSATSNNALTVSFWIYGGASQPAGASVFWFQQLADGSGTRAAQAHIPWSDTIIYWDTSNNADCCNSSARMFKAEPDPTKWKGRWNHYALVKDGARKEIWQNGALFHEAINDYPLTTLRQFTLGAGPNGGFGYDGLIDDFALWDVALSGDAIAMLAAGGSPMAISSLKTFLATDLSTAMHDVNASAYVRIPFQFTTPIAFDSLQLNIRYDDGFVAYLNGAEVARRNAPATLAFNSSAPSERARSSVFQLESIDLVGAAALLRPGPNILALHGLNDSASSADFLLWPQMTALQMASTLYLPEPTPGAANATGVSGFVADTSFSVNRGFFAAPFDVRISCPTPGATLVYTTNNSVPSLINGFATAASGTNQPSVTVRIRGTTVLRAAAFKADHQPSDVDTQTYLFPSDVARQPVSIPGLPAIDYQVDPDVVNTTLPGYSVADALRSIPVVCLTTTTDDMFGPARGIYINSLQRGDDWERPVSVEYFSADGAADYHVNAGVRIYGNISRQNDFTPKHSFSLFFRSRYGAASFRYPLFPDSAVEQFDRLVLKGLSTDTWPCVEWGPTPEGYLRWQRLQASYIRDQWARDAQLAMGQGSTHGRFVHLFLNGLYFGLYNLDEHPDAAFQASYYGGEPEEYDALKDFAELDSGTMDAWNQAINLANAGLTLDGAYQRLLGNNPNGTRNPAYPVLLDVDNLIDYMILHIFIGGDDWPYHNWWAARRRGPLSEGFRFFAWDQEISNNSLLKMGNALGQRYELVNAANTPAHFYSACRANASFRVRFADRVHKHLFNDGALTQESNNARWRARSREIDQAVVAESARWGDTQRSTPYKRENEWLAHEAWMQTNYWVHINAIVLQRFRNVGLYPNVSAPLLNQFGGSIAPGFELVLSQTNAVGVLYFTLDGTDPRLPNGTVAPAALAYSQPVSLNSTTRVRARVKSGAEWSALVETVFYTPQEWRALAVTEIMFHPPSWGTNDGDQFEFIELKNNGPTALDLSGFAFTSGISFTFTNGTRLGSGQFLVLVRNPVLFATKYPGTTFHGVYGGGLDNGGEMLRLTHPLGGTVLSVAYDDQPPWPLTTDNGGFSLVPRELSNVTDPSNPASWRASRFSGGSPGADDPPSSIPEIKINEILAHTTFPLLDAIELYNPAATTADISGWYLTDDPGVPRKFRFPSNTLIAPGGYLKLDERQFNAGPEAASRFSLNATGEGVYLFSADNQTNLTGYSHGVAFGAAGDGESFGRWVNSVGEEHFPAQQIPTLGATNSGPRIGPVVFSEIQYHPETGADEFIELQNVSSESVALFHPDAAAGSWRINGLSYTLPVGVVLEPGAYAVIVGSEPTAFRSRYHVPANVPVLGPFQGVLQDSGERLELQQPEFFGTNGLAYVTVDEVRYNDRTPWPPAADGSGPSLQRTPAAAYGNEPANWVAARPTPGGPFTGGAPPEILTEPLDTNVVAFQNVTFSVSAMGAGSLEYQWRFDGTPIAYATNATLLLTNVQPTQAGSYSVAVFNLGGAVLSASAYLTVLMPATITQQPQPQAVQPGANATFSVAATGQPPLRFQWRFNGGNMPEATNSTLLLTNVQPGDDGLYSVVVTDAIGSITSASVRLTVLVRPGIAQAPWEQTVVPGGTATFTVIVSNNATLPLGYRWRRGTTYVAFYTLNQYVSTYVVSNVQANSSYSVVITNLANPFGILSASAPLTVLLDTDRDGLPDLWENAYGLNATDPLDRTLDSDGDSLSNWQEYLAGTDPTNALSYLKVESLTTQSGKVALEFLAVSNRAYSVLSRELMDNDVWGGLSNGLWQTNASFAAAPTNRLITLTNIPAGATRFFRLATPGP
jgi:hypothetical protein